MRLPPLFLFFVLGLILYFPIFFTGFAGDDLPHFHIVQKNYAGYPLSPFTHVIGSPDEHHLLGYFYRPLPFLFYTTISSNAVWMDFLSKKKLLSFFSPCARTASTANLVSLPCPPVNLSISFRTGLDSCLPVICSI